jgi:hypothetical protein
VNYQSISNTSGSQTVPGVNPNGTAPGHTYDVMLDIKIGTSDYHIEGTLTVKIYEPNL